MRGLRWWHAPTGTCRDEVGFWLARGAAGVAPCEHAFAAVLRRPGGALIAATGVSREVGLFSRIHHRGCDLSPSPRELLADADELPELSVPGLIDLVTRTDALPDTPFRGVRFHPGGMVLRWRPGDPQVDETTWAAAAFDRHRPAGGRLRERAVPLMREAVERAVRGSLPAAGLRCAVTLSGGLDSTTVAALADDALPVGGERLLALTHAPRPGTPDPSATWQADDMPYVRPLLADRPWIEHRVAVLPEAPPLTLLTECFERTWLPTLNPDNMPWLLQLADLAHAGGAAVLLTGASGNAGYSRGNAGVLAHELSRGRVDVVVRQVLARQRAGVRGPALARSVVGDLLPGPVVRRREDRRWDACRAMVPLRVGAPVSMRGESRFRVYRAMAGLMTNPDWRMTGWQTLRDDVWCADPLGSLPVVALARALPPAAWSPGGVSRGLAREVMRGLVPDEIRLRTTRGRQAADAVDRVRGQEPVLLAALDRFEENPTITRLLDTGAMRRALLDGTLADPTRAPLWTLTHARAFGLGAFVEWYEQQRLARGTVRRAGTPPTDLGRPSCAVIRSRAGTRAAHLTEDL